jgi:hypothetical protein
VLASSTIAAAAADTIVTYEFVGASANFSFPGPVTATADITGTFVVDDTTQTITSVNINVSGLPAFLIPNWNTNYANVRRKRGFFFYQHASAIHSDER